MAVYAKRSRYTTVFDWGDNVRANKMLNTVRYRSLGRSAALLLRAGELER